MEDILIFSKEFLSTLLHELEFSLSLSWGLLSLRTPLLGPLPGTHRDSVAQEGSCLLFQDVLGWKVAACGLFRNN